VIDKESDLMGEDGLSNQIAHKEGDPKQPELFCADSLANRPGP